MSEFYNQIRINKLKKQRDFRLKKAKELVSYTGSWTTLGKKGFIYEKGSPHKR